MFASTSLGVARLKDRRIVQANRRLAAMFGHEPQELIGRDGCTMCSLYASAAHGDPAGTRSFPHPVRCGSFEEDLRFQRKDGTHFRGRCGLSGVVEGAASNDAIWVVEDVTERRRIEQASRAGEERLLRALDASRLALWDYDLASGEVRLSEIWSELMGGPRVSTRTTIGALAALVPAEDRAAIAAAMLPVLKGERPSYRVEHRVCRPDGELIWVLSEGQVVERSADGRALRAIGINRDITPRKRLDQGQRRDAILFDSLPIAVGHADRSERVTFVNRMYRTLFGSAREHVGHSVREMLGDRIYLPAAPYIRRALAGEESQITLQVQREDGSTGMRLIRYVPERDQAGEVVGFFVLIEDVTERKRDEEARAWLAAIVEHANDAIIGRSLDGRILSWNAAAVRLFGYAAGEVVGQPVTLIMSPDHCDDVDGHSDVLRQGGEIAPAEVLRRAKDGRMISVLRSISPIKDNAGQVIGAAITMRDMSERKRSEAQQRLAASVFDNAAEGILITDRANNILSVNRAFSEITGYTPQEAIGKNPRMLSSGRQPDAFYEEMWAAIGKHGRWQGEVWDRRKDGQAYCERLSIAAIADENGEVTHYCAIFSDITVLKKTEAELLALNAELERRVAQRTAALDDANKELEAFSYSISHDLRAPLRHIGGFGAVVLRENEDKLDAASVDHLKRIVAAGERMEQLIADLLALSRVSRQEMHRRDIDFSDLAGQVAKALIQAHPERQVRLLVKRGMQASGDPGLVRIVLENLIGNAWKFTSRTPDARIEVGLEQREGATAYYVRDNGAGFDMSYARNLFEPFRRLHTDTEFAGTGIGLSIVQRIVARHGGKIWAEAAVGTGATFHFTLA